MYTHSPILSILQMYPAWFVQESISDLKDQGHSLRIVRSRHWPSVLQSPTMVGRWRHYRPASTWKKPWNKVVVYTARPSSCQTTTFIDNNIHCIVDCSY